MQRDFGNRPSASTRGSNTRSTIAGSTGSSPKWNAALGSPLEPARPFVFEHNGDRFGWIEGHDGRWHLTLRIESGRVADRDGARS